MVNAGPVLAAVSLQPYSDGSVEEKKAHSNFIFFMLL